MSLHRHMNGEHFGFLFHFVQQREFDWSRSIWPFLVISAEDEMKERRKAQTHENQKR